LHYFASRRKNGKNVEKNAANVQKFNNKVLVVIKTTRVDIGDKNN